MKKLLPKILAIAILFASLAFSASVWPQEKATKSVTELEVIGKAQSIKLKEGREITYLQLFEMNDLERDTVLTVIDSPINKFRFSSWFLKFAEARTEETKRSTATIVANTVPKLEQLVLNLRTVIGAGMKLQPYFYEDIKSIISNPKKYLEAGLKKESLEYLESLSKRPELFEK